MVDDVFPGSAVNAILGALTTNEAASRDFVAGLDKHIHRLSMDQGQEAVDELIRYVRNWLLDVVLVNDPEWQKEAAEAGNPETWGEPVANDKLRDFIIL